MIKNFFTENKKPILIFAVVFLAELLVIFILIQINGIGIFFRGDGRDYQNLANNLIYHHTLAITFNPPYLPTSWRTPIYPFWLAFIYIIFRSYNPAIFIGAFVFALSAPIAYFIGREIFTEKVAITAAFLSGLEPWALYQSGFLAAEQIFMPAFLFGIYLFCLYLKYGKTINFYGASFLIAITALIRPISLYFIIILLFLSFVFELKHSLLRSLKVIILAFLIFMAVLSPWLVRNKIVLGNWYFSTASSLSIFSDYFSLERYLGHIGPKEDLFENAKKLTGAKNDIEAFTKLENANKLSEIAFKGILSNPVAFFKMHFLTGIPSFLIKNSYANILLDFGFNPSSKLSELFLHRNLNNLLKFIKSSSLVFKLLIVLLLFWPIVIIFSIIGIIKLTYINWKSPVFWLLFLWISYFPILTASAGDVSRYKLTINVPLFMLAVYGFYELKNLLTFNKKND